MKRMLDGSTWIFYQSIILGLVLLATWLRFWQLDSVPPGLWFDEAYYAMDAVWMRETKTWPVFLLGNNGREPMFSYLVALSITFLGETVYAVRLVSVLLGILSIPMMYRWVLTIFRGDLRAYWLALISAAGLTISFWYVGMNRSGYRANLLPLFILIVSYFFWRGWQTGKICYYLIAGAGLGLCQYTYLSARLFPLVFILFVFMQIVLFGKNERVWLKATWIRLFIMGGMSAIVSAPLLLFFINHPETFAGRVGDVVFKVSGSVEGLKALGLHLLAAIRVLIDGEDPNWRHHLLGRPVFDWFNTLGFWLGLLIVIRQYRRPHHLFLLTLLFIMWLPAPLSEPALHTLRLSGILPAYYVFVALGVFSLVNWLIGRSSTLLLPRLSLYPCGIASSSLRTGFVALITLLLLSGGVNFYDYFYHWAKMPEVYQAYDGPVVDLVNYLASPQANINVIIPFYLYTHASVRYILHNSYREEVLLPKAAATDLSRQKEISVVIPEYPPDDGEPPAFVWLIKDGPNPGVAYVSEVERGLTIADFEPEFVSQINGSRGNIVARQYEVEAQNVLALFPQQLPRKNVAFEWADNLILTGYEFVPNSIKADTSSSLFLSWEILGYTGLEEKIFIQLLDSQGNPIGQEELEPLSRKMYRWRKDGLILERTPLDFEANLRPDLYFVRLGFFNPQTKQRLQVYNLAKQPVDDEVILGPLYISDDTINPVIPPYPVHAMLGNELEVLGYSISPVVGEIPATEIKLYWQTHTSIDKDYTVFVQLLDQQNKVIAQHDSQPLNGLYPTTRWQQNDIIVDKFILPVPIAKLSAGHRLVTGMYNLSTGVRLPAYSNKGEQLLDGLINLEVKPQ